MPQSHYQAGRFTSHILCIFTSIFSETAETSAKLRIQSIALLKPRSFLLANSIGRAFLGNRTSAVHVLGMTEHQVE